MRPRCLGTRLVFSRFDFLPLPHCPSFLLYFPHAHSLHRAGTVISAHGGFSCVVSKKSNRSRARAHSATSPRSARQGARARCHSRMQAARNQGYAFVSSITTVLLAQVSLGGSNEGTRDCVWSHSSLCRSGQLDIAIAQDPAGPASRARCMRSAHDQE